MSQIHYLRNVVGMASPPFIEDLEQTPLHILIVCPYFPPENAVASLRMKSFAKEWALKGNAVTILTKSPLDRGMPFDSPRNVRVVRVPDPLPRPATNVVSELKGSANRVRNVVKKFINRCFLIPDSYMPLAIRSFVVYKPDPNDRPDVVVASGGPISTLVLGACIATRVGAKFVVDFRDPITSRARYYPFGRVRLWLDTRIEKAVVRAADLVTTVSDGVAGELRAHHSRQVKTVMNGFEPEDFSGSNQVGSPDKLSIVYCGNIYSDRSSLLPLLHAIVCLNQELGDAFVQFHYYGRSVTDVNAWAKAAGATQYVKVHGLVSHAESIAAQRAADLLVLLLWDDPRDGGVISGKLFEYIGSRRLILQMGGGGGEAARIVRENGIGLVTSNVEEIRAYLAELLTAKRRDGRPRVPLFEDVGRYSRVSQSLKMLDMINSLMDQHAQE